VTTSYKLTILFYLANSGANVYGVMVAGWSSNIKYAFLGAVRAIINQIPQAK
jgi:NADH:ubiquinone oxidoreductase subunit H